MKNLTTTNLTMQPGICVFTRKPLLLMSLLCLSLFLGSPQQAQAQGWVPVPCDANGNPLTTLYYDSDGFLPLNDGTVIGQATNTFPLDPSGTYYDGANPGDPTDFPYTGETLYHQSGIGLTTSNNNLSWDGLRPINGSLTTHITGTLQGYYTWQYQDGAGGTGDPPANSTPPDYMPLIIRTNLWVNGSIEPQNQLLGLPWILSGPEVVTVSASDNLGDSVGDSLTASEAEDLLLLGEPFGLNFQSFDHTVVGNHLVQVPVLPLAGTNGLATVALKGITDTSSTNGASYTGFGSPGASNPYGIVTDTADAIIEAGAKFITPALEAWSTACAPSLCGGNPNPATGWNPSAPLYFSGTGCEVDSTAVPASGYLTHVQLCIVEQGQDVVVKEYWDSGQQGCPNPMPIDGSVISDTNNTTGETLKALFDSTHFTDSTMIVLKLKVWDSNTGHYEMKIQGQAYNKALILQNREPNQAIMSTSVNTVAIEAKTMNYDGPPISTWTATQIQKGLAVPTMFYINTHGYEGEFASCDYDPALQNPFPSSYIVYGTTENATQEVAKELAANPGWWNQIEPYSVQAGVNAKAAGNPPYNFAFLSACSTVQNGNADLATGFQLPLSSGTDRALIGYPVLSFLDVNNDLWESRFWDLLASGFTIREAILLADAGGQLSTPVYLFGHELNADIICGRFDPIIQGDTATTLHGVYRNPLHATSRYDVEEKDITANRWFISLP